MPYSTSSNFRCSVLGLGLSLLLSPTVVGKTVARPGIVITDPKGAPGLPTGANLTSWELVAAQGVAPEGGDLTHPMDLEIVLITALPRGKLVLQGMIEEPTGEHRSVRYEVPPDGLEATYRPRLSSELETMYHQAQMNWDDRPAEASQALLDIATELAEAGRPVDAGWIALDILRRSKDSGIQSAASSLAEAHLVKPAFRAHLLRARGRIARNTRQFAEAKKILQEALALDQKLIPDEQPTSKTRDGAGTELLVALDYLLLGTSADNAGDAPAALDYWTHALEIRRRQAPQSVALWATLFNYFLPLYHLGRLEEARQSLDEALAVATAVMGPDSREATITKSGLGNIAWQQGDLRQAQALFEQVQPVLERSDPDSPRLVNLWNNLGLVAHDRGHLTRAEQYFRRSLEGFELIDPESMGHANALNNLGMVANERGAYDDADAYYARALAIYEALHPDSIQVARVLNNRANNDRRAGRLEAAIATLKRSQNITARVAPESKPHATGLEVLALILEEQGDLEEAHKILADALHKLERMAPGSLRVARPRHFLGRVLRRKNNLTEARRQQRLALAIVEKVAPESALEAQILNELGLLDRDQGHRDNAADNLCRAADSLDGHKLKVGGNRKSGNPFSRDVAHIHRDCIDALLALGRTVEAYGVLERSRARELLVMLAERDLVLDRNLPADLRRQQQALHQQYDRAFSRLQASDAELPAPERAAIQDQLITLRRQRDELEQARRAADPRLAALESPQPLTADDARRALDPGTLLLAYSLGDTQGHVFALDRSASDRSATQEFTGPRVYPISAGRAQIDELAATWRDQIAHQDPRTDATASLLWNLLMAPVAEELTHVQRLLISPQGSLNTLPFAALRDPSGRYLIEYLPIHLVASATLYAELHRPPKAVPSNTAASGKAGPLSDVIAFADPQFPPNLSALGGLPIAARTPLGAAPLPGSQQEARLITTLFPNRSRTFIGAAASESEFKRVSGEANILHLATHGYLDPDWPLDSALVLAASSNDAGDNGLLQAWEVFEELSINADLVVLSACETGLGQDLPGEGLIGLTRAFQYAGARSIVASLWQVGDTSTARLMEHFYRELVDGTPKDEALRSAQLAVLQAPADRRLAPAEQRGVGGLVAAGTASAGATSTNKGALSKKAHPFTWAGFHLIGAR